MPVPQPQRRSAQQKRRHVLGLLPATLALFAASGSSTSASEQFTLSAEELDYITILRALRNRSDSGVSGELIRDCETFSILMRACAKTGHTTVSPAHGAALSDLADVIDNFGRTDTEGQRLVTLLACLINGDCQ